MSAATPKKSTKSSKTKTKSSAPVSPMDPKDPVGRPVAPVIVERPQPVITGPEMRKKELIETVVLRSGLKKKDVKPVVESMLAVLGDALRDNRELVLQPFGKLKVRRVKKLANARVVVARIRQTATPAPERSAQPEPPENG